jgi:glycosyltransferase involved in cell wall biosynthesis
MNVLLNASNLRFGGGLTVGINLIEGLLSSRPQHHFYLLHPAGLGYEVFAKYPNLTSYPLPESFHTSMARKLWYNEYFFRRLCRRWQIDKVISLGNIGFPAGGRPQLLLIHFPHLVYPESPAWKRMEWQDFLKNSLMDQYAAYHLRFATLYAVQTEIMRNRLCKRFSIPQQKVYLIPNAAASPRTANGLSPDITLPEGKFRLLFLSKYYSHKNFEILIPLARLIRKHNLPITFTLTIKSRESKGAAKLMKMVRDHDLRDIIQSVGHIQPDDVHSLMLAHDGLFLPTLLESFSGAYVEALHANVPIFTSHYDFATAILGDAAFYFDPLNAENILHTIRQAMENPQLIAAKKDKMKSFAGFMPNWKEITDQFSELIDTFA